MFSSKNVLGRMMIVVGMSVAALATLAAPKAEAVPLPYGALVMPAGTTAAARPELAGVVIADVARPFSSVSPAGALIARGYVQDRVVWSNVTQSLHFYTRVVLDAASQVKVQTVFRTNFALYGLDTDYRLDGIGTIAPTYVYRSPAPGSMVRMGLPVLPGTSSRFVFLATRTQRYALGNIIIVLSNGQAISLPGFQPA